MPENKHSPVLPAACSLCLIGINAVTFWQRCAMAGKGIIRQCVFPHGEKRKKNQMAAYAALASEGFSVLFFVETV